VKHDEEKRMTITRHRTDDLWVGRPGHRAPAAGPALEFLKTQYRRGLQQFSKSAGRDATVEDNGIEDCLRVVTVQEEYGHSIKCSLESATSRIARLKIVRGNSPFRIGTTALIVHSYAFADFPATDGVVTHISYRALRQWRETGRAAAQQSSIQLCSNPRNLCVRQGNS
jgi:hypothetical protein